MNTKFGVLVEFFKKGSEAIQEIHGIYNSFEEAKKSLPKFLKVIEKYYGLTDYLLVDDFYIYKGEYDGIKTIFPMKLKIIEVHSGRFMKGMIEGNRNEI